MKSFTKHVHILWHTLRTRSSIRPEVAERESAHTSSSGDLEVWERKGKFIDSHTRGEYLDREISVGDYRVKEVRRFKDDMLPNLNYTYICSTTTGTYNGSEIGLEISYRKKKFGRCLRIFILRTVYAKDWSIIVVRSSRVTHCAR